MPKNKKGEYIAKKGKPSGPGHYKAQLKEVDVEHLNEEEIIADRYTNEADEPGEDIPQRHPNRNLNKPHIDKPAYS